MLDKAINFVTDQVANLSQDYVLYALGGLLVVTFIIALILSGGRGENGKIAKAVKKQDLTLLPARVASQFKKATKSHVAVSDAVPFDSSVTIPLATAGCRRAPVFMKWSVVLVCALAIVALNTANVLQGIWAAALLLVVGVVLILLISQISHGTQKKAAKTYYKLIDFLQSKVASESTSEEEVEEAPVSYQPPVYQNEEPEPVVEEEPEPAPFVFPVAEEPVVVAEEPEEEEDINAAILREVEEEKARKRAEEEAEAARLEAQREEEEAKARELEQQRLEEERIQAEEAERAREEAAAKAREEAAAQRAREEAAAKARAEAEAKARAEEEAKAAAAKSTASGSAEDVIARINKIQKEGAPLATMKEVALSLQAERRKPENSNPEQQKKLNEALATLLKCMSSNR